ncbi:MAG: tetratricopeptide repeat protein [Candidatus Azobacteroides sp.]|nr:tetratricopeptide repeat protein [Candidatus Azobacteroides sp.]
MKQLFLFFLLWVSAMSVVGQAETADSLVNVLNMEKHPTTEQLSLLYEICESKTSDKGDRNAGAIYALKGLAFAEKEGNKMMISKFNRYLGKVYCTQSVYDTASIYLNKALDLAIEANDKDQEAVIYSDIATMYARQGKYTLAMEYYMKALTMAEKTNNMKLCSTILANLGGIHSMLENYDQSIGYLERAMTLADELNIPDIKLEPLYYLSTIYSARGKIDKALEYEQKLVELSRSVHDKDFEIAGMDALTTTYLYEIKDYKKALEYSDSCLLLAKAYGDQLTLMGILRVRSNLFRYQGNYKECETTALEGLAIDSADWDYAPQFTFNIAFANAYMGNAAKAENYIKKYHDLWDKQRDKDYRDAVASMEVKYETEKKEMRIASLEKEQRLYIWLGIAGVILVSALGIVLWLILRNSRKERQLIAAKAVQDGEMGERARIAEDLHDRLGGSLSAVKIELKNTENLQIVDDKLDECIKEIREITHNLMPHSLRSSGMKTALEDFTAQFPNVHFHFFGKEKRIRERLEFIIYCCANELVTNSIRYSNAQNINVQLIQSEKHVSLIVQDDGCGFEEKNVTFGSGLKNIRDRVASCNGKLDIVTSPDKGTETIIELKVES